MLTDCGNVIHMSNSLRDEKRDEDGPAKYIQNCLPELLATAKLLISDARRFAHAISGGNLRK
jgi:hypothetical protein